MSFTFSDYCMQDISKEILAECAKLFSNHYGIWGKEGCRPGEKVQLSPQLLQAQYLFDSETCRLAVARDSSGELAGQAFYCNFLYKPSGRHVVWITQLVVSSKYQGCHLARTLLLQPCRGKNLFACGLATSHPFAVRALESAASAKCDISLTALHIERIIRASQVAYMQNKDISISCETPRCVVNTNFFVSHAEADAKRSLLTDWTLGDLKPGEEFLAVVFV